MCRFFVILWSLLKHPHILISMGSWNHSTVSTEEWLSEPLGDRYFIRIQIKLLYPENTELFFLSHNSGFWGRRKSVMILNIPTGMDFIPICLFFLQTLRILIVFIFRNCLTKLVLRLDCLATVHITILCFKLYIAVSLYPPFNMLILSCRFYFHYVCIGATVCA